MCAGFAQVVGFLFEHAVRFVGAELADDHVDAEYVRDEVGEDAVQAFLGGKTAMLLCEGASARAGCGFPVYAAGEVEADEGDCDVCEGEDCHWGLCWGLTFVLLVAPTLITVHVGGTLLVEDQDGTQEGELFKIFL